MAKDLFFVPLGGEGGGGEGAQGPRGFQGATGAQGLQGLQGFVGFQGVAGLQGSAGLQGTAGRDGSQGTSGLQGSVGSQGTAGRDGSQGTTGLQGFTGLQGLMGIQGPAGSGGGSSRLDVSQMSQAELAAFYQNYVTEMVTKDLYWGVFPITSIQTYEVQGTNCLAMTYQLEAVLDTATGEPVVRTTVAVLAPNGVIVANEPVTKSLLSKGTVETLLQGKQDTLTAGEGISIQGTTISATGGGGAKQWFGTQAQFEALQEVDMDTDYFVSDPIDYSEIAGKPTIPTKISELPNDEGYVTDKEMKNYINERKIMHIVNSHNWYGTQAEYEALQTLNPDTNYHIEGDEVSLQMTFTFTDSTQAVYDVFVKPTV